MVGVVGPFHSGKSFLLNQLMHKPAGFEVGPTVAAETMGLWIWGKPLKKIDAITGEPLYVLFLGMCLVSSVRNKILSFPQTRKAFMPATYLRAMTPKYLVFPRL